MKIGLIKAVYQNGVLKSKRLEQVKTNLWAYSDDGGPLTDNVVFTAISGSLVLSVEQLLMRDPVQEHYGMTKEKPQTKAFWGRLIRAGSTFFCYSSYLTIFWLEY